MSSMSKHNLSVMDTATKILKQRSEFIKHLEDDLTKNEEIIKVVSDKLEELKIAVSNVKELGKKVEHQSLIPLGKNIYVPGRIIHTGEYFLDKMAFPDSYSVVETLDGTMNQLKLKIEKQSELLEQAEGAKEQLEERIKLFGNGEESDDEPKEIISDKGVAIKVGDYYEILEFEN